MDYFDTVIPVLLSFSISIILCPVVIPFLKRLKFGQYVREDGPRSHLKKAGTPTMGGLIILISVAATSSVSAGLSGNSSDSVFNRGIWIDRISG